MACTELWGYWDVGCDALHGASTLVQGPLRLLLGKLSVFFLVLSVSEGKKRAVEGAIERVQGTNKAATDKNYGFCCEMCFPLAFLADWAVRKQ